jgi:hypothetical protein
LRPFNDDVLIGCRAAGEGLFVRSLRRRLRRLRIDVLLEHDLIAEMRGISPPLDLGNRASAAPAAPTLLVSLECGDEQQPEREQDDATGCSSPIATPARSEITATARPAASKRRVRRARLRRSAAGRPQHQLVVGRS